MKPASTPTPPVQDGKALLQEAVTLLQGFAALLSGDDLESENRMQASILLDHLVDKVDAALQVIVHGQ